MQLGLLFLGCIGEAKPPLESCLPPTWVIVEVQVTPSEGPAILTSSIIKLMRTVGRGWLHLRQGGRVSFTHKLSEEQGGNSYSQQQSDHTIHNITGQEGKDQWDLTPKGVTSRMPMQTLLVAPFKAILRGIRSAKSTKQRQR